MASLTDVEHDVVLQNLRAHIAVLFGCLGKRQQTVELCDDMRIRLYGVDKMLRRLHELRVQLTFELQYLVFGTENLLLILFQFLRDITFCTGKRLLPNPRLRHLVLMHIPYFKIISEHVVVSYLQTADTCLLRLSLLNLQQVVFAMVCYLASLVELLAHTAANHVSLVYELWRIRFYLHFDAVAEFLTGINLFGEDYERLVFAPGASLLYRLHGTKGILQLYHFARRHPARGNLSRDTLQVAHSIQVLVDCLSELRILEEFLHYIEPLVYLLCIAQREANPAVEHSRSHRSSCAIDNVDKRAATLLHRLSEFQGTYGKVVEAHVALLVNPRQRRYMTNLCMLRDFKVLQNGAACHNTVFQMFHAKAFQVLHTEMLQQFLSCCLLVEHPFVEFKHAMLCAEETLEISFLSSFKQYFLWLEVGYQLLYVVVRSLGGKKLSRRYIQECHSACPLAEMHGGKEVVLLVVEHVVGHCHTRRYEFCNAALHKFLCQLRVFELVADGNSSSSSDQFWQIRVEGMMRKSRHLGGWFVSGVVSFSQCNSEDATCIYGIVAIRFVEVAAAEEQQRIRVFCLQGEELLHHRRQSLFCFCHISSVKTIVLYFLLLRRLYEYRSIKY